MEHHVVHVAVDWGVEGMPIADYCAEEWAAYLFAAEATRQHLARRVIVDSRVGPSMPELPYQRLYLP